MPPSGRRRWVRITITAATEQDSDEDEEKNGAKDGQYGGESGEWKGLVNHCVVIMLTSSPPAPAVAVEVGRVVVPTVLVVGSAVVVRCTSIDFVDEEVPDIEDTGTTDVAVRVVKLDCVA
ncbi:hypothetical protein HDU85_003973 [Gaertneriomyces sp. JEL0708]|nr:hypothetical protein HDU85_003973 [Gaertneriomyces sp. JEL0708]